MEFVKLSNVELVQEASDRAAVLIEEDGVIKRAAKGNFGTGAGGFVDWNQSNPEAPGFIHNRTHYMNGEDVLIKLCSMEDAYGRDSWDEGGFSYYFVEPLFSRDLLMEGDKVIVKTSSGKEYVFTIDEYGYPNIPRLDYSYLSALWQWEPLTDDCWIHPSSSEIYFLSSTPDESFEVYLLRKAVNKTSDFSTYAAYPMYNSGGFYGISEPHNLNLVPGAEYVVTTEDGNEYTCQAILKYDQIRLGYIYEYELFDNYGMDDNYCSKVFEKHQEIPFTLTNWAGDNSVEFTALEYPFNPDEIPEEIITLDGVEFSFESNGSGAGFAVEPTMEISLEAWDDGIKSEKAFVLPFTYFGLIADNYYTYTEDYENNIFPETATFSANGVDITLYKEEEFSDSWSTFYSGSDQDNNRIGVGLYQNGNVELYIEVSRNYVEKCVKRFDLKITGPHMDIQRLPTNFISPATYWGDQIAPLSLNTPTKEEKRFTKKRQTPIERFMKLHEKKAAKEE